jgi:fumarate hydratase class II
MRLEKDRLGNSRHLFMRTTGARLNAWSTIIRPGISGAGQFIHATRRLKRGGATANRASKLIDGMRAQAILVAAEGGIEGKWNGGIAVGVYQGRLECIEAISEI